jgi:ATP adenylyltransferase
MTSRRANPASPPCRSGHLDRLWSPWRYTYITSGPPAEGCIFCNKAAGEDDAANLVIARGRHNYALLNLFPYTNGHILIAPYAHIAQLDELPEQTAAELMEMTRQAVRVLRAVYRPEGLNCGMNLGASAGAGVAAHLHMHVLPRWTGDASFMTSIGETRVLPEDLPTTWRRLREAWGAS